MAVAGCTIKIAGARIAVGVDDEGTVAIRGTLAAPARIEHRALGITFARLWTAFTLAADEAGETIGDGGDTVSLNTGVEQAGVVVLATAVTVIFAGRSADTAKTDFTFRAAIGTAALHGGGRRARHQDRGKQGREAANEPAPRLVMGNASRQCIELLMIHPVLSPIATAPRRFYRTALFHMFVMVTHWDDWLSVHVSPNRSTPALLSGCVNGCTMP